MDANLRIPYSELCFSSSVSSDACSAVLSSRVGTIGAGRRGWMAFLPEGGGASRWVTTTVRTLLAAVCDSSALSSAGCLSSIGLSPFLLLIF